MDDEVFAYITGEGIRGYGTIIKQWHGHAIDNEIIPSVTKDWPEYHLNVEWIIILTKEQAIKPDEIRTLGYNNYRGTFRRIRSKYYPFIQKLINLMENRQNNN